VGNSLSGLLRGLLNKIQEKLMATQTETQKNGRTSQTPRGQGDYDAAHMTPVTPAKDIRTIMLNKVSWGAVLAGAAIALSIELVLNLLGIGVGIAANPLETRAALAQAAGGTAVQNLSLGLSFGALAWWTVSGIIAAYAGGFAAGRLAGKPKETTAGWHGLTSWAATILFVGVLMTTAAGFLMGGSFSAMADITANNPRFAASPLYYGGAAGTVANDNANQAAIAPATTGVANGTANPETAAPATSAANDYGAADVYGNAATEIYGPDEAATGTGANTGAADIPAAQTGIAPAADISSASADALAGAALFSAIALVLGAVASWFGGRAGAVDPTLTENALRYQRPLH
jgi:hypothetical protein